MTGTDMSLTMKLRYVHEDVDRHGNVRVYFWRKGGPKIRMREKQGSAEFFLRYRELVDGGVQTRWLGDRAPSAGTFGWLVEQFILSPTYKGYRPSTQRMRQRVLLSMCDEPIQPGSERLFRDMPLSAVTPKALRVLRDRKAGLPGAGSNRVKSLRKMFEWALEEDQIGTNPARDLKKPKSSSAGYHTWTTDEVERFERKHPLGTRARLAISLLMWTGVRRSDVVRLGRQHVREGWLKFRTVKNDMAVNVPMLPALQAVIDASTCGDLTYLVTEHGKPFSEAGFGNWFRDVCVEAGVPGRAHGLRKAGATLLAERGATPHQLMAIFGWRTLTEAERYTRAAERKGMAGQAMGLLVSPNEEQKFPTGRSGEEKRGKKAK